MLARRKDVASRSSRSLHPSSRPPSRSSLRPRNKPLQNRVQIRLLLGRYAVAADLTIRDILQTHGRNEIVDSELVWQITLVPQDQ
jgi:hypothetical protein